MREERLETRCERGFSAFANSNIEPWSFVHALEERIHLYAAARSTINALKYAWTRMQTRTNTCSTIKLEAKGAIHVVTPFVAFPVSVIRPNNFLTFPIGRTFKNVSIEVSVVISLKLANAATRCKLDIYIYLLVKFLISRKNHHQFRNYQDVIRSTWIIRKKRQRL